MELPCGDTYDAKKSVWCKRLAERNFNTQDFNCAHYTTCMGMVEDAICNCLSHKPTQIVNVQQPIQQVLTKELGEPVKEFAEVA